MKFEALDCGKVVNRFLIKPTNQEMSRAYIRAKREASAVLVADKALGAGGTNSGIILSQSQDIDNKIYWHAQDIPVHVHRRGSEGGLGPEGPSASLLEWTLLNVKY